MAMRITMCMTMCVFVCVCMRMGHDSSRSWALFGQATPYPDPTGLQAPSSRSTMAKMGSRDSPALKQLLAALLAKDLTPAIVFAFARKECEGAA
jgi:hypothetical protein